MNTYMEILVYYLYTIRNDDRNNNETIGKGNTNYLIRALQILKLYYY